MSLDGFSEWLKSEEGQQRISDLINDINEEERLAADLESKSDLVYKDGQKVMRGDVFIDEYHEQLEEDRPFGVTSYVYRINEDGTIDNCFSSCFAWKANNYEFVSERSRLVKRNGKLQNPLFDVIDVK